MSGPPPPYAADIDALASSLSDLSVRAVPRPATPPSSTSQAAPVTPPRSSRRYEVHSPSLCAITSEWSQASQLTQGVPQAHVRALASPNKPRRKKRGFAVFYGRQPGWYTQWYGSDGAETQVRHVSGAIFQGYDTVAEAQAAFEYAVSRQWTGVRGAAVIHPLSPSQSIPSLPLPLDYPATPTHNPLHGAVHAPVHTWYLVYAGITPGIYLSHLECALNTVGLSGSAHDSATSLAEAREHWTVAVNSRSIRVLSHRYLSI